MAKSSSIFSSVTPTRWLPLLCAVILLHALMLLWAFSHFASSFSRNDAVATITVELLPLPEPAPVAPQIVPNPEHAPDAPPSKPAPKPASITQEIFEATLPPASDTVPPDTRVANNLGRNLPTYQIVAPPSTDLKFSVQQLHGPRNESGIGLIRWQNRGAYYKIQTELEVPNSQTLHSASDGVFDKHGISPLTYSESRKGVAEAKTHFHREHNAVSFSTSAESHPRLGGEQDIISVVWQLAGIGRHDATAFKTDVEFQIFVAGADKASVWLIRVTGLEEIDTPMGKIQAWHLVRAAPAGSDEQSVDIWLAPDREWYPVKLRYTEANGDTLDLSVSEITPVPDT